jgi:anti-sigma regulatory factor (Ser/Thr protein kinase)
MVSLNQADDECARPIRQATVISIDDPSQISVARRAALEAGRRLGLDDDTLSRAEIVAVELANNILQHAPHMAPPTIARTVPATASVRRVVRPGQLLVSSTPCGSGIQIVAIDSGVGIASVARALEDGFSTGNTPGHGLGAVKRLSRHFDIFSIRGQRDSGTSNALRPQVEGTVVAAIVGLGPDRLRPQEASRADDSRAVISTALPGETVNGDSWAMLQAEDRELIFLADGLGHGQYAHEAATAAVALFERFARTEPGVAAWPLTAILEKMHPLLRSTRGAAVALAAIHRRTGRIDFAGVGNISSVLCLPDGRMSSMVSHNGTLGHQMPRVQVFQYQYVPGALLLMHSDGITTSWKLSSYPGLDQRSPAVVAGAIYRDAWRGRDDATVLVARLG